MSGSNLAGRYAKALFELADKNSASEKVEGDLVRLIETLSSSPALKHTLKNPAVSKRSLEGVMGEILKKLGAHKLTLSFLLVVVRNGRVKSLEEIAFAYTNLMMQSRGEEVAYVTTASALQPAQITEVEKTIGQAFGSKIKAVLAVNDEILGGIIVRVGSKMLDASVSGKLDAFASLSKKNVANLN